MAAVIDKHGKLATTKGDIKEATREYYINVWRIEKSNVGLERHTKEEELCEKSFSSKSKMWSQCGSNSKVVVNQLKRKIIFRSK